MRYASLISGQPDRFRAARRRRGFTLVELLVVVSIIALLIGILLPSLRRARTNAKLTVGKANMKQIGTMIALYQTEYEGFLPIVYNYYAYGAGEWDAPARACWLSVALRDFHAGTKDLATRDGGKFDPQAVWYSSTGLLQEYEDNVMPEFWVCPFARGKGPGRVLTGEEQFFKYYTWEGRHEHYQTFLWQESIVRGKPPSGRPWPGGPGDEKRGLPKYSALNWNRARDGSVADQAEYKNRLHRAWKIRDALKVQASGLSDVTTVFCAQGEHNLKSRDRKYWRANRGSHPIGKRGGTNVLFGDTHVDWVVGTRVGWP